MSSCESSGMLFDNKDALRCWMTVEECCFVVLGCFGNGRPCCGNC